jgi:hypothetical protein
MNVNRWKILIREQIQAKHYLHPAWIAQRAGGTLDGGWLSSRVNNALRRGEYFSAESFRRVSIQGLSNITFKAHA